MSDETHVAADSDSNAGLLPNAALVAALTALCTVLVALSAFMSAKAASDSDDQYAESANALTDANFWYEQGVDVLREDLGNLAGIEIDQYCSLQVIFEDPDRPEDTEEVCGNEDGAIDVAREFALQDVMIATANENQAIADEQFALGLDNSTKSVDYQAALVLFATGLALSAWASLSDTADRARLIFFVLAVLATLAGVARFLTV